MSIALFKKAINAVNKNNKLFKSRMESLSDILSFSIKELGIEISNTKQKVIRMTLGDLLLNAMLNPSKIGGFTEAEYKASYTKATTSSFVAKILAGYIKKNLHKIYANKEILENSGSYAKDIEIAYKDFCSNDNKKKLVKSILTANFNRLIINSSKQLSQEEINIIDSYISEYAEAVAFNKVNIGMIRDISDKIQSIINVDEKKIQNIFYEIPKTLMCKTKKDFINEINRQVVYFVNKAYAVSSIISKPKKDETKAKELLNKIFIPISKDKLKKLFTQKSINPDEEIIGYIKSIPKLTKNQILIELDPKQYNEKIIYRESNAKSKKNQFRISHIPLIKLTEASNKFNIMERNTALQTTINSSDIKEIKKAIGNKDLRKSI